MYIIPQLTEKSAELVQLMSRSRANFIEADKVRHVVAASLDTHLTVVSAGVKTLSVVVRNLTELFDELPVIVTGFPDAAYLPEWMVMSAALPSVQYSELEVQLLKATNVGRTPSEAQKMAISSISDDHGNQSESQRPVQMRRGPVAPAARSADGFDEDQGASDE